MSTRSTARPAPSRPPATQILPRCAAAATSVRAAGAAAARTQPRSSGAAVRPPRSREDIEPTRVAHDRDREHPRRDRPRPAAVPAEASMSGECHVTCRACSHVARGSDGPLPAAVSTCRSEPLSPSIGPEQAGRRHRRSWVSQRRHPLAARGRQDRGQERSELGDSAPTGRRRWTEDERAQRPTGSV